jgi:hypothetical protein
MFSGQELRKLEPAAIDLLSGVTWAIAEKGTRRGDVNKRGEVNREVNQKRNEPEEK